MQGLGGYRGLSSEMLRSLFIVLSLCVATSMSAPPKTRASFGPCVGMDCLHGVLMHDDHKQGDGHGAEDAFKRLEALDRVRGKESGPCEGMDCLHGVLMHNDEEAGTNHDHQKEKVGPKKAEQQGPCQGMDCLHGVLMHGDGKQGADHKKQDLRKVKQDIGKPVKNGPCKGMDCMHGVLMHGDEEQGAEHAQEHAQLNRKAENVRSGVENPDQFLHGDDHGEAHVSNDVDDDDVDVDVEDEDDAEFIREQVKQDYQDYKKWKQERAEDKSKDGTIWGFSLPFISDTDSDTDFMKWKYLAKLLGRGEDDGEEEDTKDADFLLKALGTDHDETDMRHELANIGNTGALKFEPHQKAKRVIRHDEE